MRMTEKDENITCYEIFLAHRLQMF